MAAVVRRVRWKPKLTVVGIGGGILGALGLLVVLQQRGLVFPTTTTGIVTVVGGVLFGVAVPSLARLVAVRRINRAWRARAAARGPSAPAAAPVVESRAPTAVAVDDAPPPPPPPDDEPPPPPPPPEAGEPGQPAEDAVTEWRPTHQVPEAGMAAWSSPEGDAAPVAQLDPGLEVQVVEVRGDWGHIVCSNGWEAWVHSQELEPFTG